MDPVYPLLEGTKLRHYIEAADSTWYAEFTQTNKVTYFIGGLAFTSTPEVFVGRHYRAALDDIFPYQEPKRRPPVNVWAECEILHEGGWKRNPIQDIYVDLNDDVEEIVLQPQR